MTRLLIFTLVLFYVKGFTQTDPLYNQYLFNQNMINPAYTGTYAIFNGTIMTRAQWAGIKGSPLTTTVSASTSFLREHLGTGILIVNDRIGINNNSDVQGAVSYKLKFLHSGLSFGMQGGVVTYQYNYNQLNLEPNANDPLLTQQQRPNFTKPTVGAGLFYRADRFYLGASIPRLMNVSVQDGNASTTIYKRQLYLSGGVLFDQFEAIKLKTSLLVKVLDKNQSYFDFNTSVLLAETIWAGVSVRNFKTIGANGILEISNKFRVGYYYEFPSKTLLGSTFGTHEFMLSADLEIFNGHRALRRYF